jgi:hypothetical protein
MSDRTATGSRGHCATTDGSLELGGRLWVAGLAPSTCGEAALMLCDDVMIAHRRGIDTDRCGAAL